MRVTSAALVLSWLCLAAAQAAPLDDMYDDQDLASWPAVYERGWRGNYEKVFLPRFTPEEKARLASVQFVMERRIPGREPFGFVYRSDRDQVSASAASLIFLEDIAYAYTWLNEKGYDLQSIGDYLMMLRYWDAARGRPPKPLAALCVPRDPADKKIAEFADDAFNLAAIFVLLHEYGHAFYRHPGNAMVPAATSRANEEAADRFALDVIARTGDVPLGVTVLFFTMANLMESRASFADDAAYQRTLAARTHPLSPERLQAFARHLSASSAAYERAFKPGAKASALVLAQMVQTLSLLMADADVQRRSAENGLTVSQDDLAPRRKGVHLAPPCNGVAPTGQSFDGYYRGNVLLGRTAFTVDAMFERHGDAVSGSYSYGAGFGRIRGVVKGDSLTYRWSMGRASGNGVLTQRDDGFRGTFGSGSAASGEGIIALSKSQ